MQVHGTLALSTCLCSSYQNVVGNFTEMMQEWLHAQGIVQMYRHMRERDRGVFMLITADILQQMLTLDRLVARSLIRRTLFISPHAEKSASTSLCSTSIFKLLTKAVLSSVKI